MGDAQPESDSTTMPDAARADRVEQASALISAVAATGDSRATAVAVLMGMRIMRSPPQDSAGALLDALGESRPFESRPFAYGTLGFIGLSELMEVTHG